MENLRKYGDKPFRVAVIHGGPGAPGEMAPVARRLAEARGVLEPLQTTASLEEQVSELYKVLTENAEPPVTLIGWSWGAWLSFIVTARHPTLVNKLILIGSGPYQEEYATDIMRTRLHRLSEEEGVEAIILMEALEHPESSDQDSNIARLGELIFRADSYDPLPGRSEIIAGQSDIHRAVWEEASELRRSGELLALGEKITCAVVAIHGDYDPHPITGVSEPLARTLTDFRLIQLEKCGHHPWREREAGEEFYAILEDELA